MIFSLYGSMGWCVPAVLFNEKAGGAAVIDVGSHAQGRFRAMRNPLLKFRMPVVTNSLPPG